MATLVKRSFWMHQGAEYVIGVVFVAQGLQSPTPLVPSLLGGLVVLNTAMSKGPLGAFQVFGHRAHKMLDAVVILATVIAAVQPVVSVDNVTRTLMGLLAFALGFIWIQSDFTEKVKVPRGSRRGGASKGGAESAQPAPEPVQPDASVASSVGRSAGRLVGNGVNAYRKRKR